MGIPSYAEGVRGAGQARPGPGIYMESVDVTLACGTPGAAIYYTTDGDPPRAVLGPVPRARPDRARRPDPRAIRNINA